MEKEMIYKSRSISSCINSAYKLLSDNLKNIVRSTWLPVLLMALFGGIFSVVNIPNPDILAAGIAHVDAYIGIFVISILAMILCSIWALSRLMSMLNEQSRRWNFLRVLLFALYIFCLSAIIGFLVAGALILGNRITGGTPQQFLLDNWLVLLIASIVVILLMLPLNYIGMRYLYDKDARFWLDLPRTYKTGLRHLGFIFLTTLLASLIIGVIVLVVSIPLGILNIANLVSLSGLAIGDEAGLPRYFLPLLFVTTVLVTMVLWFAYVFEILVYLFMYGSIEKQEEEHRKIDTPTAPEPPSDDPHLPLQRLN